MCGVGPGTQTANQAGPAGEGKANIALENILNRDGSDNRVPGSRDEGAHLTGLVFTGSGVAACKV